MKAWWLSEYVTAHFHFFTPFFLRNTSDYVEFESRWQLYCVFNHVPTVWSPLFNCRGKRGGWERTTGDRCTWAEVCKKNRQRPLEYIHCHHNTQTKSVWCCHGGRGQGQHKQKPFKCLISQIVILQRLYWIDSWLSRFGYIPIYWILLRLVSFYSSTRTAKSYWYTDSFLMNPNLKKHRI